MRDYYDRRAARYDDDTYRHANPEDLRELTDALQGRATARVLDVACGTGWLAQFMAGEIVGVDQSQRMLTQFKRRNRRAVAVRADVPPLPFESGAFDRCLIAHYVSHLQPATREETLAEAKRVAREVIVVEQQRPPGHMEMEWQRRPHGGVLYRVYKRYSTAADLEAELNGSVLVNNRSFIAVRWSSALAPA